MKRFLSILIAAVVAAGVACAQDRTPRHRIADGERTERADRHGREKWNKEMRELKHEYIAKQLDLTRDQRDKFFDIYDKMDDEIAKINDETRSLEMGIFRRTKDGETITDTEYEAVTNAILELKNKEYLIEKEGYEKLGDVLSKKQIFDLRRAERDFGRMLMEKHRGIREKK